MIARLKARLTYSNVVATIAIFMALGGGAYAASQINGKQLKKRSVAGKKLKKNTVTGKEVKEATLARVPDAAKLGGQPASAFAKGGAIEQRIVGASGQPAFENSWFPSVGFGAPAFGKDPFGFVHLEGAAQHTGGSTTTIFTLPAGYRPASDTDFAVGVFGPAAGVLSIEPDGTLSVVGGATTFVSLEGVTFRAG
jgi:hypothetical protein